ncbi:MAG: tetratricopeptide repeat protein [Magnetococcales bacterium]|nr:tetratricopeptide repeat protein [Magnetococcales bacterium]
MNRTVKRGQQKLSDKNRQNSLKEKQNIAKAHEALQKAITYHRVEQLNEAIYWYKKALKFNPADTIALTNMGTALQNLGKLDDAISCYQLGIDIKPDHAQVYSNLGVALQKQGKLDQAIISFEKATALSPDYADAFSNMGDALREQGEFEKAVISCQKALTINPSHAQAYSNLGNALKELERLDEAVNSFLKAITLNPDYAEAHSNLGIAYQEQGQFEKAINSYRKAIAIAPNFTICHNNLICCIDLYTNRADDLFKIERDRWAKQHAAPLRASWPALKNSPDPEKKLRIGYVGADFKHHSAAHIFGSVLLNYDSDQFEIYCYAGNVVQDDLTQKFKQSATGWLSTTMMDDKTLAREIKKDGIDILVDLAGHTIGSRLLTFARKPAPIQLSAWGYPHGTAMAAMDYILADQIFIPLSERSNYSEEILDIKCVLHLTPDIEYPEIAELPYLKNGYITFGAFNRIEKYSNELYIMWAEILKQVPDAKLLIKTGKNNLDELEDKIKNHFFGLGVEKNRLIIDGKTKKEDHLKRHNSIDIMLDPHPHNGGMTTLDSLRMGVPVLTCEGEARCPTSASILHVLGLDDWRASNKQEYVKRGVEFAQAIPDLKKLRQELRQRFDSSVLGDPILYTRDVEAMYRKIWKKWCNIKNQKP